MALISVIIPSYNKELYITRTLKSILSQTFTDFELIIIDSSTDRSPDIIMGFSDTRIKHIRRNKLGAAKARNLGVKLAKSDFVAFIDADDEWTPKHLQELFNLYKAYPAAGLYATPYIKIRSDGFPMVMIYAGIPKPPWQGYIPRYFWSCTKGDVPVCSSNSALRKEVFNMMGGFREDLIYGEDQDLWGRIALKYLIAFSWEGPVIYHTEAGGRICKELHLLINDPFSDYANKLLNTREITGVLADDLTAYIHRKEKSIWFSNLINNSCNATETYSNENNFKTNFFKRIKRYINYIFLYISQLYNSKIYNFYRRIICLIHGWYVPKIK